MARGKVLFEGKCDVDQLHLIFNLFGTPDESTWPKLRELPYWRGTFPLWKRNVDWKTLVPMIPPEGWSLLEDMLVYCSETRMTAQQAKDHPYAVNRYK